MLDGKESGGPRFAKSPEESANVLSKAFFLWTNSLYKLGLKHALQEEDLWPLVENDKAEAVSAQFDAEWNKELAKPRDQRSLKMAVWRTFRGEFILGGLYKLINDVLVFAGPLILNLLIQFINTPSWPLWLEEKKKDFVCFFFLKQQQNKKVWYAVCSWHFCCFDDSNCGCEHLFYAHVSCWNACSQRHGGRCVQEGI
jgi:hypothetical protein